DNVRLDTYVGMAYPAVLTQFEPHMHNRGKAMCLEAIYPPSKQAAFSRNGGTRTEILSCVDRFNFGWVRSYVYADDVAPVVPAGALAIIVTVGAAAAAQIPFQPGWKYRSGQNVVPAFEGWERNADGSFDMIFGYYNRNYEETLDIPVGPGNSLEPGGPDQGQP